MNVRRKSSVEKGLRDYIVPIIGLLLIIILIFNVFSGDSKKTAIKEVENKIGLSIQLEGMNSESFISYPGDHKEKIVGSTMLYKGEKIIVKEGIANLQLNGIGTLKLNKLGELKYLENGDFSLYSSDLWLDSLNSVNIKMRFASVHVGENSHVSFSQNEMGSTIYLINGFAEVSNQVGESSVLASGQKMTISRLDASKKDLDVSLLKENIDDYYKQSDWFIKNNGSKYLNNSDEEKNEEVSTGVISKKTTDQLITFSNLYDEANVSSNNINISGTFLDDTISKIVLNGEEAKINTKTKSFIFEDISVNNLENDLVFKIYDDANDLLSKFIYVIYYNGAIVKDNINSKFTVQTFDVDGSQFKFTSIKDGIIKQLNGKTTHVTYGDFLTLYGNVTAKGITKVVVDGYALKSFNGKTWRYHPSSINNNLNIGTNVYEVKYFSEGNKLVYTNHFTIIKKNIKNIKNIKNEKHKLISDEIKID